ncbi:hypothetical protein GCM10018787_30140 [Streptomyces thermodiastaticus]|nr:hypothetical protein GCM10018787_30140 [Streptomyces thermodiastaticus]
MDTCGDDFGTARLLLSSPEPPAAPSFYPPIALSLVDARHVYRLRSFQWLETDNVEVDHDRSRQ